jgi:hypothetical protein
MDSPLCIQPKNKKISLYYSLLSGINRRERFAADCTHRHLSLLSCSLCLHKLETGRNPRESPLLRQTLVCREAGRRLIVPGFGVFLQRQFSAGIAGSILALATNKRSSSEARKRGTLLVHGRPSSPRMPRPFSNSIISGSLFPLVRTDPKCDGQPQFLVPVQGPG